MLEQVPIDAHRGALERAHVLERLDVGLHVLVDGHGLAGLPLQPLVLLLELEADLEQLPLGLGLPLGLERAHRLAPLAVGVLVLEHPAEGRLLSPQEGGLVVHAGPFLLAPHVLQIAWCTCTKVAISRCHSMAKDSVDDPSELAISASVFHAGEKVYANEPSDTEEVTSSNLVTPTNFSQVRACVSDLFLCRAPSSASVCTRFAPNLGVERRSLFRPSFNLSSEHSEPASFHCGAPRGSDSCGAPTSRGRPWQLRCEALRQP